MIRALASWSASRFRPRPALAPTVTWGAHEPAGFVTPAPAASTATPAASRPTESRMISGSRTPLSFTSDRHFLVRPEQLLLGRGQHDVHDVRADPAHLPQRPADLGRRPRADVRALG